MSRSTDELVAALKSVEIPTLGHFLEEGFCDQDLRPMNSGPQLVGRARTLDLTEPDAFAVNRALLALEPGDVLVIRVAGRGHAPVGAVTAHAAIAQGAAGIVVDGPVTDQAALRELRERLPVFATGLTARTTKRSGALAGEADGALDRVIEVAGVSVRPGDFVLGDAQGILILPPEGPGDEVLDAALASDAAEPALVARIASGEPLSAILATGTD
ncbi:MAG: RraA family protein [Leucobacter sp.]